MSGRAKFAKLFAVAALVFLAFSVFVSNDAYAGMNVGGGGGAGGETVGGGNGCGDGACPGTMWVYYTINDRSQSAYIGSAHSSANSITISDCGPYGGFWILQYMVGNGAQGQDYYRAMTGARTVASLIRYKGTDGTTSSTQTPKKGVYNAINSNVTPYVYNWPACWNGQNSTCGVAGGEWRVTRDYVKDRFKENNGGSVACTIGGTYYSDCFGSNSPLTYFCYGDDPEETFTLSYDKNTTDSVSSMPSSTSCTTTTGSCSVTVGGVPSRSNWAFTGWNTKSDGSGTGKSAGSSMSLSSNKTLYAQWTQYSHTLKYDLCSGSGTFNQQSTTDGNTSKTFTIHSGSPTRTGHKFLGWSTTSCSGSAEKQPGNTISVGANATTTLYAVWQAYTVATFSAPEITITSTELNNTSGNNWRGLGNKDKYTLTATYHVKRENDTPSSATSYYGTRSANSNDGIYPSNGTESNALTKGNQQNIPTSYTTVSIANGSATTACFYFKYDDKVYYDGTTRVGSASTATTYKCVSIYNPAKYTAQFSGSVSLANGSGLSGSGSTRTGSGYKSTFTLTPNYTIERTDGLSYPTYATSGYAINATSTTYDASSYPGDSAAKTNTSDLCASGTNCNKSTSWNGTAATIDIDIGGGTQYRCFYLRHDNSVLYYVDTREGLYRATRSTATFNGKSYACVSITNPAQSTTISFTGAPISGTMTANDRLWRSDSNRIGTINNHDRTTSGNDDVIGKWVDNNTAMNATYTADFTHRITRNDSSSTILGKTMKAKVSWKVQYAYPSVVPYVNSNGQWVVAGVTWADYAASHENAGNAVSGTSSLGASETVDIVTQPKLKANQGQILYYCQRVAYTASITYKTITVSDRNDYGVDDGAPASMTTYSSPLCVTLKNPKWSETDAGHLSHIIDLTATPTNTEIDTAQFDRSSDGTYNETLTVSPTIYVHHSVTRTDSGDDESDAIFTTPKKFWQSSIYSNSCDGKYWGSTSSVNAKVINGRCKVITNLSGYVKVPYYDANHHLAVVTGGNPLDGALAISLGATAKGAGNGETWNSTKNSGASWITFDASGTAKYVYDRTKTLAEQRNVYSLMAGQTLSFEIDSSIRPARWVYDYVKINLNEYYTSRGSTTITTAGSTTFDRIEKTPSTSSAQNPAVSSNPAHRESSPVTFRVNRPYNFKITSAVPGDVSGVSANVAYSDDSLRVSYSIDVNRENDHHLYITDPNHTGSSTRYVSVVTYVLPASTSAGTLNNNPSGIHSGVESNICSHFTGIAKNGTCNVLTGSEHPTHLSKDSNSTIYDPSSSPQNAVTSTFFRHVYDASHYKLSYQTGSIAVQNPDGSPIGVGEKFCVAIAIANYSSASSDYFISNSTCRNISKRPSAQVWGGSAITNGGIDTSESTYAGKRFGSWADYALIAKQEIKRMNSGATSIGGVATNRSVCDRSPLTIANKNCGSTSNALGFANIDARTDFSQKLLSYFNDNTGSLDSLPNVITSGRYILRTDDNLTINRNIEVSGSYNSDNVPQVIIIAKNINITSNVTRLDAWLIASDKDGKAGTIDTCSDVADDSLSARVCTNTLTVNGELYAGKIKLKRTAYGDPATGSLSNSAELVDFSPTTILWGNHQALSEANPRTVYLRKLPTRY